MCTLMEYRAKFEEFIAEAANIPMQVVPKIYQMSLSRLSMRAADFYYEHADINQPDYQTRINIFLDFDILLKQYKGVHLEYRKKLEARVPSPSGFFSRMDLLDIKRPESDPRSPLSISPASSSSS